MSPLGRVLVDSPKGRMVLVDGALVAIWRGALDAPLLGEIRGAFELAAEEGEGRVPCLTGFRLDARFPLEPGHDVELGAHVAAAKALARRALCVATVLELGHARAAVLRAASRAVWALARPGFPVEHFERPGDAAAWIGAQRGASGAQHLGPGPLVRAYHGVSRALADD